MLTRERHGGSSQVLSTRIRTGYFWIRESGTFSFPADTASVHRHPAKSDILESALQTLSRMENNKSATNPITCGRGNFREFIPKKALLPPKDPVSACADILSRPGHNSFSKLTMLLYKCHRLSWPPTSFPGSLILPLPGASEERPWLGLVTCLLESGRLHLKCWREGRLSRKFVST